MSPTLPIRCRVVNSLLALLNEIWSLRHTDLDGTEESARSNVSRVSLLRSDDSVIQPSQDELFREASEKLAELLISDNAEIRLNDVEVQDLSLMLLKLGVLLLQVSRQTDADHEFHAELCQNLEELLRLLIGHC